MPTEIDKIQLLIQQQYKNPFEILGPQLDKENKKVTIRTFLPQASYVKIVAATKQYPMKQIHPSGLFEVEVKNQNQIFDYKIQVTKKDSSQDEFKDSYSFPPNFTDFDVHLIKKGELYKSYDKLGAHLATAKETKGVYFSVWAPNATSVSVIGNFNNWNPKLHMMGMFGDSGIWEIFVPDLEEGSVYKYRVNTPNGHFDKTDPYGFYSELSPKTASIVYNLEEFAWNDASWMEKRAKIQSYKEPISIYEVHLGSWKRKDDDSFLSYRELAPQLVSYVKDMGYTHIEILPVLEHPFYGSWGYQTIGYFAPTSRYGEPKDFMYFVDYCHQNDIGVLLDWVPAHFPKDSHGLCFFDGTHLYEHDDPRQREHLDWDTYIYNYGRYEVKNFLISSALFWLDKYHLDGLRVDAVASMLHLNYSKPDGMWIPNKHGGNENLEAVDFIRDLNTQILENHKDVIVLAEESTTWPGVTRSIRSGGLGFDMKWNMGWMNDVLKYMGTDPIHRKYNHSIFPFCLWYAFNENFVLVLSHDEVVHGKKSLLDKMFGNYEQKFANLRLLYGFMYGHPGKKMLFMGGEIAQWKEWNHDASLDWGLLEYDSHRQIQRYVKDLNHLYKNHKCLYQTDFDSNGFEWCDYKDTECSILSFFRKTDKEVLLFVFNFTPIERSLYHLGVPYFGEYIEIFNSDASIYGGENVGNMGQATVEKIFKYDKPYTLTLTLPALGMLIFKVNVAETEKVETEKAETEKAETEKAETEKAETIKESKPNRVPSKIIQHIKTDIKPITLPKKPDNDPKDTEIKNTETKQKDVIKEKFSDSNKNKKATKTKKNRNKKKRKK